MIHAARERGRRRGRSGGRIEVPITDPGTLGIASNTRSPRSSDLVDERRGPGAQAEPNVNVNPNAPDERVWIRSVVDEYERPLTIYATRLLRDGERARDVVQDTFMKLCQADRAAVDGHLAKWLYTVCRNRALDVRRKEHRMTTLDDRKMEIASGAAPTRANAVPDPASGGVLAAVDSLTDRQQEVVRLKFQGGLSYREIAEVMDTTVNNVGVLLHTAIKTIRVRLAAAAAVPGRGAAAGPAINRA